MFFAEDETTGKSELAVLFTVEIFTNRASIICGTYCTAIFLKAKLSLSPEDYGSYISTLTKNI